MRILTRTLALLAGALAICGAAASAASAAEVISTPSIRGAGQIATPTTPFSAARSCSQSPPVADDAELRCPGDPWNAFAWQSWITLELTATAASGWTFVGWSGCPVATNDRCSITAIGNQIRSDANPVAIFEDRTDPALTNVAWAQSRTQDHRVAATWDPSEPGVRFSCEVDGVDIGYCSSPLSLQLGEGEHSFRLRGRDPSGNAARSSTLRTLVVDTELVSGPAQDAYVADGAAQFVARTRAGGFFECSLDGRQFARCGQPDADGYAVLNLPAVADGRHDLQVRAGSRGDVDVFPASVSWNVDTRRPDTRIVETSGGFTLEADESPVTFRCSLDGAPYRFCASPYTPVLAPGPHTLAVYAVDRAGNTDPTSARLNWTTPEPPAATPTPTATPAPVAAEVSTATAVAPALVAAPAATAAPQRLSFKLRYATRNGRLTRLTVTDLTPRADLRVSVKCPKRKRCPKGFAKWNALGTVQLKRLVGKRLPAGTKVTVRARRGQLTATQTITIKKRA